MLSSLEKFYLRQWRHQTIWAALWEVAKALFLMLLGALISWLILDSFLSDIGLISSEPLPSGLM